MPRIKAPSSGGNQVFVVGGWNRKKTSESSNQVQTCADYVVSEEHLLTDSTSKTEPSIASDQSTPLSNPQSEVPSETFVSIQGTAFLVLLPDTRISGYIVTESSKVLGISGREVPTPSGECPCSDFSVMATTLIDYDGEGSSTSFLAHRSGGDAVEISTQGVETHQAVSMRFRCHTLHCGAAAWSIVVKLFPTTPQQDLIPEEDRHSLVVNRGEVSIKLSKSIPK